MKQIKKGRYQKDILMKPFPPTSEIYLISVTRKKRDLNFIQQA